VIDSVRIANNRYEVSFSTQGFTPSRDGLAVAFYWEESGVASGTLWTSGAVFSGFSPAGRPAGTTQLCVIIIERDGSVRAGSERCVPVS
jgi:hypothetical protein